MPEVDLDLSGLWPHQADEPVQKIFQAPIFPTLCKECNSNRLGTQYDPALMAFADDFARWMRLWINAGLSLPREATVNICQSKVARAVVGHLLAAERPRNRTEDLQSGIMTKAMRSFFLGGDPVPDLRLFVWPYRGDVVIARSFANMGLVPSVQEWFVKVTHRPIFGDVLKFFPLAFWVVWALSDDTQMRLTEISLSDDSSTLIKIPLFSIPPSHWPEEPTPNEVVAIAGIGLKATTRNRKLP